MLELGPGIVMPVKGISSKATKVSVATS